MEAHWNLNVVAVGERSGPLCTLGKKKWQSLLWFRAEIKQKNVYLVKHSHFTVFGQKVNCTDWPPSYLADLIPTCTWQ